MDVAEREFGRGLKRRGPDGEMMLATVAADAGEPADHLDATTYDINDVHGPPVRDLGEQTDDVGRDAGLADVGLERLARPNHAFGYAS